MCQRGPRHHGRSSHYRVAEVPVGVRRRTTRRIANNRRRRRRHNDGPGPQRHLLRAAPRVANACPERPDAMPWQHPEDHFGRGPRRDFVDQCSAYACPVHAYARPPRRTTSTCRSPRNRSSPATSRRARPAYACVRRTDKAPRKSPEKLGSSTRVPARTRWSQPCAYASEREEPDELVAGVGFEPTTFGL